MSTKPSATPNFATGGGAVLVAPDSPHISIGWSDGELPPAEMFNWLMNNYYLWAQYLNDGHVSPAGNDNTWVLKPITTDQSSPSPGGMDAVGPNVNHGVKLRMYDGDVHDRYVPQSHINSTREVHAPLNNGTNYTFADTAVIAANSLKAGSTVRAKVCGQFTSNVGGGSLTVIVKLGSTTLGTVTIAPGNNFTGFYRFDLEIIVLTNGAGGTYAYTVDCRGNATGAAGIGSSDDGILGGNGSIDTTVSNTISVNAASTSNNFVNVTLDMLRVDVT